MGAGPEAAALAAEYTMEELQAIAEDEGVRGARHDSSKLALAEKIVERWGHGGQEDE